MPAIMIMIILQFSNVCTAQRALLFSRLDHVAPCKRKFLEQYQIYTRRHIVFTKDSLT